MGVIRLSSPLVLIYLVFSFGYLIKQDFEEESMPNVMTNVDKDNNSSEGYVKDISSKQKLNLLNSQINDFEKEKTKEFSKPIVAFNPKPITIDSNLKIQKDKNRNKSQETNLEKDNNLIVKNVDKDISSNLKLKEIMICRGVYKRNPIKPGFKFTNNVDSLFCYTKISNSGSKQEIKHVWYYQDKLITSVAYNIKTSYNYRSWSRKNISPNQVGKWRVDVIDSKDNILGSRKFDIASLNDLY